MIGLSDRPGRAVLRHQFECTKAEENFQAEQRCEIVLDHVPGRKQPRVALWARWQLLIASVLFPNLFARVHPDRG